jgi:hypothetical protein
MEETMKPTSGVFVTLLLMCLLIPFSIFAQVNATVGGTVSDASGALIPGVEITARSVATGIVTNRITNEAGNYDFPSLQPGVYTISASLSGFQTATYNNVQLSQSQQVRLNFSLQVGTVAQAVEVVAEANTLLATTTSSVGDVLPDVQVRSLPLASRNVLDLVRSAAAGAVGDNFAGARMSQMNTTRDGLPTMDGRYNDWNGAYSAVFTSPDLVEEVQIVVNSIDAAAGRGSGQVKMQTRSGGNDFHGALFYTNKNSALASQGWFQNLVGAQKTYQNRNQFGGRLGGPIIKNKAFFFVLIDQQRYVEKQNIVSTVFTAPARQGIFRYLTENATGNNGGASRRNGNAFSTTPSVDLSGNTLSANPATGAPLFLNSFNLFSDVRDPNRTRIDPVWVGPQYLTRMPLPNDYTVGDGLNTAGFRWLRRHPGVDSSTGNDPNNNRDHLSTRIDYQLNTNNKLTYTMSREKDWGVTGQTGLPDFPSGYFGEIRRFPDLYTLGWTSTISPTLLNEARWGYKRDSWFGWSPFDVGCCVRGAAESDIGESSKEALSTFPQLSGKLFYTQLGTVGGAALGNYAPFDRAGASPRFNPSPLMQFADTLSWIKGAHSFQVGMEFTHSGSGQNNSGGIATAYAHAILGVGNIPVPNINVTNFRGLNSNDITPAQDLLANLAGTIRDISEKFWTNSPTATDWLDYTGDTVFVVRTYRQNDWAGFFKDNWKVTNNFTLNLGLRYDKYGVPYDLTGMATRVKGGQAGFFGISGTDFSALWNPYATGGTLTNVEPAGKHSPNPDVLPYKNDWNNFAPSVGFSWSLPWFKRSTVLRAGYGINYAGAPAYQQYGREIGAQPGSQIQVIHTPSTYLDIAGAGPGLVPLSTGGARPNDAVPFTNRATTLSGFVDDRVIQYSQNINLSVQRELVRNLTLDVSYVGNKGSKLWNPIELNEPNIFENGILDAFNITRAGGNAVLFDRILNGLNVTGVGVVNGTSLTGSQALRRFTTTNQWIANGDVANLANWLNSTSALTGSNGGLLRNGNLPENFIVVNPQFGSVALHGNNDNSTYHALQTEVKKRFSDGFTGQFSYTWSKNLGNSAAANGSGSSSTAVTRDPRNRALQKGLIVFDRSHQFKGNGTWDLPFGSGRRFFSNSPAWLTRAIEGWEVSGIFSWLAGAPLSFTSPIKTLAIRANTNANTPDLVGSLPADLGKVQVGDGFVQYFANLKTQLAPLPDLGGDATLAGRFTNQVVLDASGNIVMQSPRPGTTGTMALNLPGVKGPGTVGLDMALSRKIRINEKTVFTLRADAINILNKPQWALPDTNINSGNFGRIASATGSRTVLLNARVDF